MIAWEVLDAQGRVRKRVVGSLRFAAQFQHQGAEWRTLRRAHVNVILPRPGRSELAGEPLIRAGAQRARVPARRATQVIRIGSAAARAKRERLRARLDAGGQPFVRRLVEALIEAGALDHFRED